MSSIEQSLGRIFSAIGEAAKRSGRRADEVTLVAASKGARLEQIEEAAKYGVRFFGENRVQEAERKFSRGRLLAGGGALQDASRTPGEGAISLHLIGSLQTNKVKRAVGFFDLIHSIDSIHLAEKVEQEAAKRSIRQPVLVEVNIAGEESKRGVPVDDLPALVDRIGALSHLSLLGLMALPPFTADPEGSRPYFARLREVGRRLGLSRFSMGMSADFEVAIEEGATWVRIGTAIFGPRPAPDGE